MKPPMIEGVSDEPEDAQDDQGLSGLLGRLMGAKQAKDSSAKMGEEIIKKLEKWAVLDPMMAPIITEVIEKLEGEGESEGASSDESVSSMFPSSRVKSPI